MYKFKLAIRYLLRRPITYLAVAAVGLCVFTVVVVMTVMTGLVNEFKVKNHQWTGDCVVVSDSLVGFGYYEQFVELLEREPMVEAASPVIRSFGLFTYEAGSGHSDSVEVVGLDAARHCRVTGFGDFLHYHKRDCEMAFEVGYDANLPGAVLGVNKLVTGRELESFRARTDLPRFYFSLSCFPLTAKGGLARGGLGLVSSKQFYFSDDSHSGLARVDGDFVYIDFDEAQRLCGMAGAEKRASAIHIKFRPGVKLAAGCEKVSTLWANFVERNKDRRLANLFDNVTVQSWKSYRRETIAAMEKEQVMMTAVFIMIGIITVFIIFVIFYMIISHKSKDIGILKSVGVSDRDIRELFLGFGLLVGLIGSGLGTFFAILFLRRINELEDWLFSRFGFELWDRTIYAIGDIPNRIEIEVLAVIIISAIFACMLGALIPSGIAARLKPAEALQVSQL